MKEGKQPTWLILARERSKRAIVQKSDVKYTTEQTEEIKRVQGAPECVTNFKGLFFM
jgi:hypothetical protein